MDRRQVSLVAGAALAAGILFYLGWRFGRPEAGKPPPPAENIVPESGPVAATEPVYPPPRFHANVMLEDPFPGRPELSPTRVSVDSEGETARIALARIVEAAGSALGPSAPPQPDLVNAGRTIPARGGPLLPDRVPPGLGVDTESLVSLHLRQQPVLEALYQLQGQAPLSFFLSPSTGLTSRYQSKSGDPPTWSIAGPFAEVIDKIEYRQAVLRPLGVAEGAGNLCSVGIRFYTEPRIRVLTYPRLIDLTEARDEHGNSLIAPRQAEVQTQPQVNAFPSLAWLALPRENPGAMIKVLRGTGRFALEGPDPMPTIKLDDPLSVTPVTKEFAGMQVTFEKPVWNSAENGFDMGVTYARGTYQGDWDAFAEAVGGVKPRAAQGTGRAVVSRALYSTVGRDSVRITFGIQLALVLNGSQVGRMETAPAVESFTFDMPVGAIRVDVPVEFRDLQLP